eukprot:465028-Prymnesium_polylepis.1
MRATGHTQAGGGLINLLIQPVQRVPRYKLLLEQLLKLTPADHPDHAPTKDSLAAISRLAVGVNEVRLWAAEPPSAAPLATRRCTWHHL